MAMNKEMTDAFNEQINAEMFSAYLYLSMGSWFEEKSLNGFAGWFRCQYLEENMHAMKMYNFVNERGGRVILKPIEGPDTEWKSYVDVFTQVLEHEEHVTSLINGLMARSRKLNDYASESFLMWYVDEQVEEEATAGELLAKLKLIGDNPNALIQMDKELAARAPSPNVIPIHMNQAAE